MLEEESNRRLIMAHREIEDFKKKESSFQVKICKNFKDSLLVMLYVSFFLKFVNF